MKNYHKIWLSTHNRSEDWLKEKLMDGFDIHHADGNHKNNDPNNLVLVEATDHSKLHYFDKNFTRINAMKARQQKADLLDEKFKEMGLIRGSYATKKIKGKIYWYFRNINTYKEKYICPDSEEFREKVNAYRKLTKVLKLSIKSTG